MKSAKGPREQHAASNRASRACTTGLEGAGYTSVEQLSDLSLDELKKLHGVGPKAIHIIRDALEAVGMSLAEK